MGFGCSHCSGAEWQRERGSVVPGFPLVHVVGAEEVSGLSGHDVQRGLVEVGEIRGESFRGPVVPGDCLDRVTAARLLLHARSSPALDDWNFSQHRMLNLDRIETS